MHWVSGTILWAKHKATRSTGTPIYLEKERSTRHNRRRTWSLPTKPGDASETSTISDRGGGGVLLHRVESCQAYPQLRCTRCGGLRSRDYHYRHLDDPAKYPSVGICSRERTRCAMVKSITEPEPDPELEKMAVTVPGTKPGTGTGAGAGAAPRAVQAPFTATDEEYWLFCVGNRRVEIPLQRFSKDSLLRWKELTTVQPAELSKTKQIDDTFEFDEPQARMNMDFTKEFLQRLIEQDILENTVVEQALSELLMPLTAEEKEKIMFSLEEYMRDVTGDDYANPYDEGWWYKDPEKQYTSLYHCALAQKRLELL